MAEKSNWNKQVLESIVKGTSKPRPARKRKNIDGILETHIQQACVKWFAYQHNDLWQDGVLFHIPNEGIRLGATGRRMKSEGIVKGVADLCLALPRHGYGALYIELKRPDCYQSAEQKQWQRNIERHGNKYVVCKSLNEFMDTINSYLAQ